MSRREHTGVFKVRAGVYGVDYRTPDGKRHRPIIGSQKLAMRYYQARQAEIFENRYQPAAPVRMTFSELAAKALESKRGRIAPRSWDTEAQRIKAIEDTTTLGSALIDTVTAATIDALLTKILNSGKSGATCNRYRSALSSCFSYAVDMELLAKNPVRKVRKYPEAECRRRFLAADEEPALRQAVRKNYPEREPELVLILHTGLRKGEMFALRWVDVDLERGQIIVQDSDYAKTGFHAVDLNSAAVAALRELYANSNGRAKVCQPGCYSKSNKWLRDAIKIAGIEDLRPHDLRHTFASRAIERGVDLPTVQECLGHRSILTTRRRYVHLSASHKRAQLEKLVNPLDSFKDSSRQEEAQVIDFKAVEK